jgi:hypothetical protein
MVMDTIVAVLWLSVGLQILAAILALRLTSSTGRALGWVVLSTVFFLMALRRGGSLLDSSDVLPNATLSPLLPEAVALAISVLSVLGILLIADIFKKLRSAEQLNARQREELREFQRLTVGRELRAGELTKENKRLRALVTRMSQRARPRVIAPRAVAVGNRKVLG